MPCQISEADVHEFPRKRWWKKRKKLVSDEKVFTFDRISSIKRPTVSVNSCIALSGTDKAIILNPAAHAIGATFAQRFDPYDANPAENRAHAISRVGMMNGNTKSAFGDLTRQKCRVRKTIEAITAEIVSRRLHNLGGTGSNKAERPVHLHPRSSSPLSDKRIRFSNLMRIQASGETVDGFRQHKKVPTGDSIFRATTQQIENQTNPSCANYLHQFSMFVASLQIPPNDRKTFRSSISTGDYVRLDTGLISVILTNVS
jgi:hypothetical protein